MGKQIIRLTEQVLHNIIKESVKTIISESQAEIQAYVNAVKAGLYDKLIAREGFDWIKKLSYKGDIRELLSVAEERYNQMTGDKRRLFKDRTYTNPWNEPFDPDMGWH